ncbi:MAG: peptide ABC transporter permease [Thermoleophilia bacterium]|nr:peptide ABC transporter permease [Thermoleophilia bacterium]
MFLALREMRRAKVRFGLLISAIGLLVLLILAQQAIQNGLITSFIGAIERQSAPVLVYSVDGQRTLQGSVITPPLEQRVRSTEGIAKSGRIGQGTFTVAVNDSSEDSDAAIIGYDDPDLGTPVQLAAGRLPQGPGEAVGSDNGFELGDRVQVLGPRGQSAGTERIEVVGLAEDAQLQVTPTLFVKWPDYVASVKSANPDARRVLPSAIGAAPVKGLDPATLAERINDSSKEADALTRQAAANETPGVAEVRSSFQVIFLLFGLVVPLVTGLFFLIITLQKSASLTLLRAVGARSGLLVRSLMFQVVLVIGGGLAVGIALYTPLSQAELGEIKLSFDVGAVLCWSALLLGLGLLSALVAARRVLAIDPIEATTGEGGR